MLLLPRFRAIAAPGLPPFRDSNADSRCSFNEPAERPADDDDAESAAFPKAEAAERAVFSCAVQDANETVVMSTGSHVVVVTRGRASRVGVEVALEAEAAEVEDAVRAG